MSVVIAAGVAQAQAKAVPIPPQVPIAYCGPGEHACGIWPFIFCCDN